jgi:hypothetical protein
MKRIFVLVGAVLVLGLSAGKSHASWGYLGYSGYQPWWNIFAKRYKCLTPEEERLQKFWHDYYDAMKHFYKALDHIDWVAYYKNHGYQINGGCGGPGGGCCGRINYAPVFVAPTLQWAVPAGCNNGPPLGPGCAGPVCAGVPGYGGGPMPGYGDMHAGMGGMGPMYAGGPSYPMAGYPGSAYAYGGMANTGYPGAYMSSAPVSMPMAGSPAGAAGGLAGPSGAVPSPMPTSPVSSPMPGAN